MSTPQLKTEIRIIIADDHPLVREGLRSLLETQSDFKVIAEANDGGEALELAQKLEPDILLLDMVMPGVGGLDVLSEIVQAAPAVRTILVSGAIERAQIVEAIALGAQGLILKQSVSELLFKGIRAVMAGHYWVDRESVADLISLTRKLIVANKSEGSQRNFGLTPRERQIINAVSEGQTNKDIAKTFSISEQTVKHHLTNIFDKTGVSTRVELALFALNKLGKTRLASL